MRRSFILVWLVCSIRLRRDQRVWDIRTNIIWVTETLDKKEYVLDILRVKFIRVTHHDILMLLMPDADNVH